MLKEIKSVKVWTDHYEQVEKAVSDFEVLFDFYREGDVSEEDIKQEYAKAAKAV